MSNKRPDRRVQRTHQALTRALLELSVEKGFDETTVSDIVERANVGRSTFYAHFADKDDLLQGSLVGLAEALRAHVAAALDPTLGIVAHPSHGRVDSSPQSHPALGFALPMLEHAAENRPLFRAMVQRQSRRIFLDLVHDMWAGLIRETWDKPDELVVQATAGAFGSVIHWWLVQNPKLTPAQVNTRFCAVMTLGLPAVHL